MRLVLSLTVLLLSCLPAGADEDVATRAVGDAADEVVAAAGGSKTAARAALEALAARDDPDPWLVADALVANGKLEAAKAFAAAAKGPARAGLADYVGAAQASADMSARREVLSKARQKLAEVGPAAAIKMIPEEHAKRDDVVGVETARFVGDQLKTAGRRLEAARMYADESAQAELIGWLTRVSHALRRAAALHWDLHDYAAALALYKRQIGVERRLGSDMGAGRAHFGVATSAATLGRMAEAKRHRTKARELALASGDNIYAAKVFINEGVVQAHAGDTTAAIASFASAAKFLDTLEQAKLPFRFRRTPTSIAQIRAGALTNAASMSARLGREKDAISFSEAALAAVRKTGDDRATRVAQAMVARIKGAAANAGARYLEAVVHLGRAHALYKRLGLTPETADTLRRLGHARRKLGNLPRALEDIEAAIAMLEPLKVKRPLTIAHADAGSLCISMDRHDGAGRHIRTSLRLARELGDPALEADALTLLSSLHRMGSRYGKALEYLHEAQAIHRKHPGKTESWGTILQLSYMHTNIGDYEKALEYVEQCIALVPKHRGSATLTAARMQRAAILRMSKRYDEALTELNQVLTLAKAGGDRTTLLSVLNRIGSVQLWQAHYEKAYATFEHAVGTAMAAEDKTSEISNRIGMGRALMWNKKHDQALEELGYALELAADIKAPWLHANALGRVAEAHYLRGDYKTSIASAREGIALTAGLGRGAADETRAAIRGHAEPLPRWGAAAALKSLSLEDLYFFVEYQRSGSLVQALGGRSALRAVRIPRDMLERQNSLRGETSVLLHELASARRRRDLDEMRGVEKKLDLARQAERDVGRVIQRHRQAEADLDDADLAPLDSVQKSLAPKDALVLYGFDGWRYFALVVRKHHVRVVTVGREEEIHPSVRALAADPDSAEALTAVRASVIAPLAIEKDVKRVISSPSRLLTYIPFGLVDAEHDISLAPSATSLEILRKTKRVGTTEVLALGDPSYENRRPLRIADKSLLRGRGLVQLPATRDEAKAVGTTWLLGKDASETKFREMAAIDKPWRGMHFACHGLVDEQFATQSSLALTQDDKNDGFLRARELLEAGMVLRTDLVVLSGCETGRGRVYSGYGLIGLSRAFMLAGARRVMASLWKVDDAATSALMKKFYSLWNPRSATTKGISAAAALRQAQAFVRAQPKWKEPRFWAAWVLWGPQD